ncbi:MAG TPA: indole-3-glycerol phosphate synthase TrpC [Planctomycetota bacterium]|nr:indole-3-glycerol phosphate synthase TrpC [Planctomycetota bacterium]
MEDILVEIVANTRRELVERKERTPVSELEAALADAPPVRDFAAALLTKKPVGVIAEVKKASPSRGIIREDFDPVAIAREYETAGAAAVSVLTEEKFFQGKLDDLKAVRAAVSLPVLCKNFIVDRYQLFEARAAGADAVLLISEVLSPLLLKGMVDAAHELGMQALVEFHDREHAEGALLSGARLIGINNRNLKSFRVDLMSTERLAPLVPAKRLLVSESGIASNDDVRRLAACGVKAILVGETLMQANNVAKKMRELMGEK